MENLSGGLFTVALLMVIAYFIKLDLIDITGWRRKAARGKMANLGEQLGFKWIQPRTPQAQGMLEKQYGRFSIQVDADRSRVNVEFNQSTGLRISSQQKQAFNLNNMEPLDFERRSLNKIFKVRAAKNTDQAKQALLEGALLPLLQLNKRDLQFIYIKDEYLRLGFEYRNYMPLTVIEKTIPVLEQVANAFVDLKQAKHGNN